MPLNKQCCLCITGFFLFFPPFFLLFSQGPLNHFIWCTELLCQHAAIHSKSSYLRVVFLCSILILCTFSANMSDVRVLNIEKSLL